MSLLEPNGLTVVPIVGALLPPVAATAKIPQHIDELLEQCLEMGGSDLHLAAGAKPTVRVNGSLVPIEAYGRLHGDMIERLVFAILNERNQAAFISELELDTSYAIPGKSRFRMNVFRQRGTMGAVLRTIPFNIPEFETLHMPEVIRSFAQLPRGLVLVTGPDGIRQVDDARRTARHHQPDQGSTHPVVRRPDRVLVQPQEGHREPTRSGRGHEELRCCTETCIA